MLTSPQGPICSHLLERMCTYLCAFFQNKSFSPGLLPTDWKMANIITTIHKKGHKPKKKRELPSINFCCLQSGGEDSTIQSYSFLAYHHVLNPNQSGYVKGKSSLAELLSYYDHWCLINNYSSSPNGL